MAGRGGGAERRRAGARGFLGEEWQGDATWSAKNGGKQKKGRKERTRGGTQRGRRGNAGRSAGLWQGQGARTGGRQHSRSGQGRALAVLPGTTGAPAVCAGEHGQLLPWGEGGRHGQGRAGRALLPPELDPTINARQPQGRTRTLRQTPAAGGGGGGGGGGGEGVASLWRISHTWLQINPTRKSRCFAPKQPRMQAAQRWAWQGAMVHAHAAA